MDFPSTDYQTDSPHVETIWSNYSVAEGTFDSIAVQYWEIVFTKIEGKTHITLRGPETSVSPAYCPPNAQFFGIQFKPGSFMPHLSVNRLTNEGINLPLSSSSRFWLDGVSWEIPTFDNADVFIHRLARQDMLIHDSLVDTVLNNQMHDVSLRTAQRRFRQATGLTHSQFVQIERALHAQRLLEHGASIMDVTFEAGYADHPHLTRSLKKYLGKTPTQIIPPIPAL